MRPRRESVGRGSASFVLVLALVSVVGSCADREAATGPGGPPGPMPVTVATPLIEPLVEWDRYTGRIVPVEEVTIQARVSGYLDSLHFTEGQLVAKGDLLAVIDPRPFEAELATARARMTEALARMTRAEAVRNQAIALLGGDEASRDLSVKRLENAKEALSTNAIAREQVDIRESELVQANAKVESARASVALAEAEIASAEALIAVAGAALQSAELELSYTQIVAPIAGRVGDRLVTRGNFIQSGLGSATAITNIVSLNPIHVYFDANEQEFLKYVRLSDAGTRETSRNAKNPVFMSLIDEKGYPHRGHMDFVDNRLNPNTGTIRGRAIFRNDSDDLTPGLFATVRLPGTARYDAMMIPDTAILSDQASQFVYVLDESNVPHVRRLELGPIIDGLRVVRAGLSQSDRVIVNGLQRVRPGVAVAPEETKIEIDRALDGLPNDYEPVPREEWISGSRDAEGTGDGR